MDEFVERVRKETLRLNEDCVYNSYGHFIAAKYWRLADYTLNLPAVLLSAFASFFAFTTYTALSGILSMGTMLLVTASLFLGPTTRASSHMRAGEKYLALRNKVRLFSELQLSVPNTARQTLIQGISSLTDKKNEINSDSPPLPDLAYKRAKARIAAEGHKYDVDRPTAPNIIHERSHDHS